jgi:hypothetical protein
MNVDQSLVSRIRNLFREQGITIASILTAVGFIISTIILALTGRTPNKTTPTVNQSKGGQQQLRLRDLLRGGRAILREIHKLRIISLSQPHYTKSLNWRLVDTVEQLTGCTYN